MPNNQLLVITGPTASGKTVIAASVAAALDGEIISADSRQVYRGMNIGTGKDLDDYRVQGKNVPYHLIDIVDPGYEYNVYEFSRDFRKIYTEITSRGKLPIMCGGTGMYIDSVVRQYILIEVPKNQTLRDSLRSFKIEELTEMLSELKPDMHNISDVSDRERALRAIEIQHFYRENPDARPPLAFDKMKIFGIRLERQVLKDRISSRLESRLREGMVDEVSNLMEKGVAAEKLIFYGLEYRFITEYLLENYTYDEMVEKLRIAIFQFSKRQMTWFRRMEKSGVKIEWVDGDLSLKEKVGTILECWGKSVEL
jgi:tRNA dimethylallyltransferase